MDKVLLFLVMIPAIILHEVAHGYMALKLGDPTAKRLGRLSLNPISHIDPVGSILIPAVLIVTGAPFFIGWAKPVPVDTSYFKRPVKDMMWVALAGPLTNIAIAVGSALMFHILGPDTPALLKVTLMVSVQINLFLAIFNMCPIPPLDGSRVLMFFSPPQLQHALLRMEPYGLFIVMALAYFDVFWPILTFFFYPMYYLLMP